MSANIAATTKSGESCARCGSKKPTVERLDGCPFCQTKARYCSSDCRIGAWKTHKHKCRVYKNVYWPNRFIDLLARHTLFASALFATGETEFEFPKLAIVKIVFEDGVAECEECVKRLERHNHAVVASGAAVGRFAIGESSKAPFFEMAKGVMPGIVPRPSFPTRDDVEICRVSGNIDLNAMLSTQDSCALMVVIVENVPLARDPTKFVKVPTVTRVVPVVFRDMTTLFRAESPSAK